MSDWVKNFPLLMNGVGMAPIAKSAVAAVSKSGTDRQTDRRTRDRCIDPAGSDSDCDEKK